VCEYNVDDEYLELTLCHRLHSTTLNELYIVVFVVIDDDDAATDDDAYAAVADKTYAF